MLCATCTSAIAERAELALAEILRVRDDLLTLDGVGDDEEIDLASVERNRSYWRSQDLQARRIEWNAQMNEGEDAGEYPTDARQVEVKPASKPKWTPMFGGETEPRPVTPPKPTPMFESEEEKQ